MPIRVKPYVRRRLDKKTRIKGMIASAKSRKTPRHLREGLKRHLRKEGIKIE